MSRQAVWERFKTADIEGLEQFNEHKDKVFENRQREIVNALTDAKVKDMSGLRLSSTLPVLRTVPLHFGGERSLHNAGYMTYIFLP